MAISLWLAICLILPIIAAWRTVRGDGAAGFVWWFAFVAAILPIYILTTSLNIQWVAVVCESVCMTVLLLGWATWDREARWL